MSKRKLYDLNGRAQSLQKWADEYGLQRTTVRRRLARGMTLECALTDPLRPRKPIASPPVTFNGRTQTLNAWAREVGVSRTALKWRLDAGWAVRDALTRRKGASNSIVRSPPIRNQRGPRLITFHGRAQTLEAWADEYGESMQFVRKMKKCGLSIDEIMRTITKTKRTAMSVITDGTPGEGRDFSQPRRDRRTSVAQDCVQIGFSA